MAGSDITVTGLVAEPLSGGNSLTWIVSDPRGGVLPNIALDDVEIWGCPTNNRALATLVAEGKTETVHSGIQEQSDWYYWARARNRITSVGPWHPDSAVAGVYCRSHGTSGVPYALANGKLNVSATGGGVLTVRIKAFDDTDPSPDNPVYAVFPSSASSYTFERLTAATSITLSTGSTLGAVSGKTFKLWLVIYKNLADNSLVLGLINCFKSTDKTIYHLRETGLATSIEGGAGGADSAQVCYSSVVLNTNHPLRVIAYLEWRTGLTTAGFWNSTPIVRMYASGDPLPGEIIKEVVEAPAASTFTSIIPKDNTIPDNTEGQLEETTTFAPVLRSNLLVAYSEGQYSADGVNDVITTLFCNNISATDAIATGIVSIPATDSWQQMSLEHKLLAEVTSLTFSWRAGVSVAGTGYRGSAALFGGTLQPSKFGVREIMT